MKISFMHIATTYGYLGVFVLLILEYLILVVPGETLLTTLGILSHTNQIHLNLPLLIVAASLGTFTGSMLTYLVGNVVGRPVIRKFGKYIFITEKRLQQTERLFQRQAVWTLLITKYIAVIRDVIPYVSGLNKISLKTYIPVQLIASFLWTSTFLIGGSVLERIAISVYHHWKVELIPGVLILAAIVFGYRFVHARLKRFVDTSNDQGLEG